MTTALVASAVDPDVSASLVIYEKLKPLKDALGVKDLSDQELQLFALVARHTGLDPFTKQIYAIKRSGRVSHQTGIDGYRSVAERTGQYAGSDEATYEDCDCGLAPKGHPKLARVVVHRILAGGHIVDQVGIARWHELYPGDGDAGQMWRKGPFNQLAKCAEANGLRKAFSRVLGGVYISEEMQGAQTIEGEAREVGPAPAKTTTRDRLAARRAEAEASKAGAPLAAADPAPEEVEGQASFLDDAPAAETVDLATAIRAAAAGSDLEGPAAKESVKGLFTTIFAGWDRDVVIDGIRILFDEAAVKTPTAAQVHALEVVGTSIEPAAFWTGWQQLVDAGTVKS